MPPDKGVGGFVISGSDIYFISNPLKQIKNFIKLL
jgi:hypothetical protein